MERKFIPNKNAKHIQPAILKITSLLLFFCLFFLQQMLITHAQEISLMFESNGSPAKMEQEQAIFKQIKNAHNRKLLKNQISVSAQQLNSLVESAKLTSTDGVVDLSFNNPNIVDEEINVKAITLQSDGKILVGGFFNQVNDVFRNNIARLNADGSVDMAFNTNVLGGSVLYGSVISIVVQPDGKILIGGNFSSVNNVVRRGIARLNPDGTLDTNFDPGNALGNSNFYINKIALQLDGKILIGGYFTQYNGVSRAGIARINSDGSLDTTFDPGTGFGFGRVGDVVVQPDGKILISGLFFSYNGMSAFNFIRVNSNGSLDTSFKVNFSSPDFSNRVHDIELLSNGKIFIVGRFLTVNNIEREAIALLNADGSLDNSFADATPTGFQGIEFTAIAVQPDGKIVLGGNVKVTGVAASEFIVRLSSNGTIDSLFAAGSQLNNLPNVITVQPDGKILVGGLFGGFFAQPASKNGITRLNNNGSADSTFNIGNGAIYLVAGVVNKVAIQSNDKILVCGNFDIVGNGRRTNVARLNSDGTLDASFKAGINYDRLTTCNDILIQPDGKILAAGSPNSNNAISNINRFNTDGSKDLSFNPPSSFNTLYDIALQSDGKIIINDFIRQVSRLNSNGSLDTTFTTLNIGGGAVDTILVQPDNKILIGGSFTYLNNIAKNKTARLNSDGTFDNTFDPGAGPDQRIYNFDLQPDGKILIVGLFTKYNNIDRKAVARLNQNGSLDTLFAPQTANLPNALADVLYLTDGKIAISTAGLPDDPNAVAILNSDGSVDKVLISQIDSFGFVSTMVQQQGGKIIIGGRFATINNVSRTSVARLLNSSTNLPRRTPFDFDGDGKTDYAIFRPSAGEWWYLRSSDGGNRAFQFGQGSDKIVPADYTGDGKTDVAFFRPSTNEWFILRSEDSSFYSAPFGASGDIPVPADYDGDGKADLAVFRPSEANWYINKSSGGFSILQFGAAGDVPVPADYDGDGKADLAIFRPSKGEWWFLRSSDGGNRAFQFGGGSTDKPVPADYTGDGKTDVAFYRSSTNEWFVLRSENGSFYSAPFGASSDVPVAGDYDGDGKADIAVWRATDRNWYIAKSSGGFSIAAFGSSNDKPVPSAFVP